MKCTSPFAAPVVMLIRCYQRWVSPALPPRCRFHPSCSAYAAEALQIHGLLVGGLLAAWRLLRCAPWHPGGIDPVPPRRIRIDRAGARSSEERAAC